MRPAHPIPMLVLPLLCLAAWALSCCTPPRPSYQGYGYLIVAPRDLLPEVEELADYKASSGLLVDKVSLEEILAGVPGRDGAERLRNVLARYATLTPRPEFALLVGAPETLPMRTAYPWAENHGDAATVPTDFYYEDVGDDWDADGDGFFGEYGDDLSPYSSPGPSSPPG